MEYLREMAQGGYNPDSVGPFHLHMIPWLLTSHGIERDTTVLDIGAGQGHGLIPLHRAGFTDLIAADRDPYNFDRFEGEFGFRTLRGDITHDKLELETGSVGAVLCLHLIEHLADPENLLEESFRVLKPGGQLFVVTPDWRKQYRTFYRDPTHIRPYDKDALSRLLRGHCFETSVHSWGSAFGLGRLKAFRHFPSLGRIGRDIQISATRPEDAARTELSIAS